MIQLLDSSPVLGYKHGKQCPPYTCPQSRQSPDYVLTMTSCLSPTASHIMVQLKMPPPLHPRSNWIDGIHRENCHFASKPPSILEVTLDKGSTIETGSNMQRFWQKNSEEKISPQRLNLGHSCCWWKSIPVWQNCRQQMPWQDIRWRDAMAFAVTPITWWNLPV